MGFSLYIYRVVEIPAYIGGMFVMDKLGRRPTLSGGLIISGIACLITGLVPEGNRPITF
jgi:OCT family organic cation transporter-like MFS transporter 4/5